MLHGKEAGMTCCRALVVALGYLGHRLSMQEVRVPLRGVTPKYALRHHTGRVVMITAVCLQVIFKALLHPGHAMRQQFHGELL